jgi:plastocyanin
MSFRKAVTLLGLATFAVACGGGGSEQAAPPPTTAAAAPAAAAAGSTGNATISGKVNFQGTAPAAEKVKVAADPKCQAMHPQGLEKQPVQVKEGGLGQVFVWVKNAPAGGAAPTEAVELDQQGCEYHPHIVTVRTGQPLKIKNNDDTLHNIHPRPTVNAEFNIGQPRKGMESTKTFDKQEIMIPVGCDVHPWMRSYISVVGHPYFAVTKEDGSYEIKGLPPGDYEVEAIHEKLKSQTQKVSAKDGDNKVDFTYQGS